MLESRQFLSRLDKFPLSIPPSTPIYSHLLPSIFPILFSLPIRHSSLESTETENEPSSSTSNTTQPRPDGPTRQGHPKTVRVPATSRGAGPSVSYMAYTMSNPSPCSRFERGNDILMVPRLSSLFRLIL